MTDLIVVILAVVVWFWLMAILIRGIGRVFKKNFVLALLLLFLLTPFFVMWAFIEGVLND